MKKGEKKMMWMTYMHNIRNTDLAFKFKLRMNFDKISFSACHLFPYFMNSIRDIMLLYLFRSMMSRQGLKSLFPMEDIAVMGIWELLPHLNKIRVSSEPQSSLHKPVYMWSFYLNMYLVV